MYYWLKGFKRKAKARCQVVQDARTPLQSDNKTDLASFLFLKKLWMMLCCHSMIKKRQQKYFVISKYASCLHHSAWSLHFAHHLPLRRKVGCPDSCWDVGVGEIMWCVMVLFLKQKLLVCLCLRSELASQPSLRCYCWIVRDSSAFWHISSLHPLQFDDIWHPKCHFNRVAKWLYLVPILLYQCRLAGN